MARAGYREVSTRENALFNLLTSFVTTFILARLIDMARDAATPPRQDFPGPIHVRRSGGKISASS